MTTRQRTALINRIRGFLSERGIVLPLKAADVRREAHKHLEDLPSWCKTVELLSNLFLILAFTSILRLSKWEKRDVPEVWLQRDYLPQSARINQGRSDGVSRSGAHLTPFPQQLPST